MRFRFSGPPTGDASAAQDLESGSALAGGAQDGADGADDDTEKPVSSRILSVCFLYFSIALFTAPLLSLTSNRSQINWS